MFKPQYILLVISAVVLRTFAEGDVSKCQEFCKILIDRTNKSCEENTCSEDQKKIMNDTAKKMNDTCTDECPKCVADKYEICVGRIITVWVNEISKPEKNHKLSPFIKQKLLNIHKRRKTEKLRLT
ncbi:hypothetical protein O3M35_003415 [Rhynocoris fuscipes]|uniref:Uncharacterized protein n=1 Tax=Rhynocoris fuscipes TaxID=488301 RepID=A0AAW1CJY3_9HEMI